MSYQFVLRVVGIWLLLEGYGFAAVPDAVAPKAEFFGLDEVRLLDGPFKTAQDTDEAYLLKLEPDRLLAWYRKEAGLTPKGQVYGGWESMGVAGHTLGHYVSAISQMYAATGDAELKRRADYIVSELDACQKAIGTGYVAAIPNGKTLFAQLKAGEIHVGGTYGSSGLNGGWAPWYTIHKELAGLLDTYTYCHNAEALDVARRLGDWIGDDVGGLSHDQMQQMLGAEHGGVTEALANLYGITGEAKYLETARKFRHDKMFLPLAQGQDILTGFHVNTQIPKFIGYQRVYELTGDAEWNAAAQNFWTDVTRDRAFVNGAVSEHENFFAPDKFEEQMNDVVGPESCDTYNMLKLTEHIFEYHPDGAVMDYYENALYNHILSTVRPHQDGFVYYTSLSPGSYRTYSTPFDSFWCCVDTGMENHAKYGKAIYAHEGADQLLVNLFIASTLDWREGGLKLEQKTGFPEEAGSTLVFHPSAPRKLEVDVRYPNWVAAGALKVTVNGETRTITAKPGEYAAIKREWKEGDTMRVETPMELHTKMLPHSADYVSVLFGPLVLAGELGAAGLTAHDFVTNDESMDAGKRLAGSDMAVVARPVSEIAVHLKPVEGERLAFVSEGLIKPSDVRMVPFYKLYNERYTVYWRVVGEGKN